MNELPSYALFCYRGLRPRARRGKPGTGPHPRRPIRVGRLRRLAASSDRGAMAHSLREIGRRLRILPRCFTLTLLERLVTSGPPMRLFAAILLLLIGCHRSEEPATGAVNAETAPISVQTAAVVKKPMPEYLTVTGNLRAHQATELAADAAGKVTSTAVERGQKVKKGDVLVTLDSRGAALSVNAAEAQAKLVQTQLEQARRDCERSKHLLETGAVSKAEYDRTSSLCQSSQWSAAAAQVQERSANKAVGDMRVRAPFDGIVGERYVNVGQYVASSTPIVSIYNPDPLRLEMTIPEANVGAIKPDM